MLKCSRANGKISERTSKRAGERQRQGGRVSESVLTKERACLHERQACLHRLRTRDQSEQGTVSEKREGGRQARDIYKTCSHNSSEGSYSVIRLSHHILSWHFSFEGPYQPSAASHPVECIPSVLQGGPPAQAQVPNLSGDSKHHIRPMDWR